MSEQRDNADAARMPDYATVVRERDEARAEVDRLRGLIRETHEFICEPRPINITNGRPEARGMNTGTEVFFTDNAGNAVFNLDRVCLPDDATPRKVRIEGDGMIRVNAKDPGVYQILSAQQFIDGGWIRCKEDEQWPTMTK